MKENPEDLFERLAAAIEQTLCASDLVQEALSCINTAGYDLRLDVWATVAKPVPGYPEDKLEMFGDLPITDGKRRFDSLLTSRDVEFLHSAGISEVLGDPRRESPKGANDNRLKRGQRAD